MIKKIISVVTSSSVLIVVSSIELLAKEQAAAEAAQDISVFWVLPFIGILLCIAIIPLINAHFWERNLWWISLGVFCVPMAVIFTVFMGEKLRELSIEKALDYVSFIILLASLFVISGGILIKGSLSGTPKVNTIFILIGSVIASFIGTTGASMLLVRPLIRANKDRLRKAHVIIFFIFIVSNIGGSLTPLGDPPLFLGYLQGVPFEWTFRLAPQWAIACLIVLIVFFFMDTYMYRKEPPVAFTGSGIDTERFGIDGKINLILLGGVVVIVFLQGLLVKQVSWWPRFGFQETGMAILLGVSLLLTPYKSDLRQQNGFTFGPIKEVALLFAGIFAAMIPALYILEHKGASLGITQPWQFFWATGSLSSFLDNAPTYLTFLSLAKGLNLSRDIILNDGGHVSNAVLTAISCGAVFMGANSYIGNGPNFMVKSIAEEQGIKMPSFFGYMAYSTAILIPTFILITFIFFI
ncbi:MAG TPA: sodium:proton antiporter [Spirochaetota bacterium]|nr:sodium:proton antiporter [Spirochaetota bacterium]HPC39637.1 sodium:proton antiporter [Spirochaetota bacterium]HPL16000.1 sodium:proton antiporter [Spirochaetota bacterium]HQF07363.1 sodium:proton antiporter [Spirochaetota bacterium]HQH99221.1 sodium:proton antiporter [Spirochaetota bacterium]